jgi:hypothetical protein
MKRLCLIPIILSFHTLAFSQVSNYIPYYELSRKADIYLWQENYKGALNCYKEAFAIVDYPLHAELYNALLCCAILQETESMFFYLRTELQQGYWFSIYDTSDLFAPYRELPEWESLLANKDTYLQEYEFQLNTTYRHVLDSLDGEDQKIRTKKNYWPENLSKSEKPKKYKDRLCYVDSCNAEIFDHWYSQYGYPSVRNVGKNLGSAWFGPLCLHHRTDSAFLEIQYQAVRNGLLSLMTMNYKILYTKRNQCTCVNDVDALLCTLYNLSPKNETERILINNLRKEKGFLSIEEEINLIGSNNNNVAYPLNYAYWGYRMLKK